MPVRIDELCGTYVRRNTKTSSYISDTQKNTYIACKGAQILKDSKFNPMHVMILKFIEKVSPLFKNHPKLGKTILLLSEKMLKNADSLK